MKLKARELLLFSIAFSSVLKLIESSEIRQQVRNEKNSFQLTSNNSTVTYNTENKTENLKTPNADHGLDKRSAEIFPEEDEEKTRNKEFFDTNNSEKRTRLGFAGMRGKKEFSADDYCTMNARTRLGFPNKRFYKSFNELFGGKRASLAFHGMRGKKSDNYDSGVPEYENNDAVLRRLFLIDSGLMDNAGETSEFLDEKRREENEDEEGLSKRSLYAFQGMRGKKENANDLKKMIEFLRMRGNRATEVWNLDGNYKRAPQTSFFGMKGKKAQSSGFFGMRGKKASPNAFFGIKGKREPLGYDLNDFSLLNQMRESGSSRNRFRRGITWLNNSKKARNAFFGIRGKKSTQESFFHEEYKMRFKFCGDLDCPDWVLAEINTLSKMSSIKVKMLCQIVAKSLTGNGFDEIIIVTTLGVGSFWSLSSAVHCNKEEKAKKLVLDAKLGIEDMKACVSALSLIFGSSARYVVEEDVLNNELQQLGLPKEHATALCKVYSEHLTDLTEDLKKRSMRTSFLEDVSCSVRDLATQKIELHLKINDKIRNVTTCDTITMTSEQLALLLIDLKSAREEMKTLPS